MTPAAFRHAHGTRGPLAGQAPLLPSVEDYHHGNL